MVRFVVCVWFEFASTVCFWLIGCFGLWFWCLFDFGLILVFLGWFVVGAYVSLLIGFDLLFVDRYFVLLEFTCCFAVLLVFWLLPFLVNLIMLRVWVCVLTRYFVFHCRLFVACRVIGVFKLWVYLFCVL